MMYSTNITQNEKTKRISHAFKSRLDHRAHKTAWFSESLRERKYRTREITKSGSRNFPVTKWAKSIHQRRKDLNADVFEGFPSFAHKGKTSTEDVNKRSRPNIVIFYPIFRGTLSYFSEFKRIFQKREIHFFAFLSIISIFSDCSFATDYTAQAQGIVRESQTQRDSNLKTAQDFIDGLSIQRQVGEFSIESQPSSTQADPWGEAPVSEFSESKDQAETEHTVLENIPDQQEGETCCGVPKSLQKQEIISEPQEKSEPSRQDGDLLIFVSFSLPDQALKNLYEESLRLKARLILRGLHKNSFQETRKKAQQLGIQVDIDPTLFEKHAVKVVPTFVPEKGDKSDKVSGNIAAQEALSILQGESE